MIKPLPDATQTWRALAVGLMDSNDAVGVVELARPTKFNAFDAGMFAELPKAITALEKVDSVRVIVISGQGLNFCAGIDVAYLASNFMGMHSSKETCPGLKRERLRREILATQEPYSCIELCKWPVIAAVHGRCIGGGVDLISACDLRVCSEDASFCVKEIDLAITADLGSLQRLPHIVGHAAAMDLALTARTVGAQEAHSMRLVTQLAHGRGRESALQQALSLAASLASKPALALIGTKRVLLHTRDHPTVSSGLEYIATWNAAMLESNDMVLAMRSMTKPRSKL